MNFEVFQDVLKKAAPLVTVKGGQIDKDAPEVIAMTELYFKLYGKKVGVGTCRNCIFDAFFELKQLTINQFQIMNQVKKFILKRFPIYFGPDHQHYTNANITDDVAIRMVKFNKVNAANFENPSALLAAAAASNATVAAVSNTATPNSAAPAAPTAPVAAEPKKEVSVTAKSEPEPIAPIAPEEPKKEEGKKAEPKKENNKKGNNQHKKK